MIKPLLLYLISRIFFIGSANSQNCDSVVENFKNKIIANYAGFSIDKTKEGFLSFYNKTISAYRSCDDKLKQIQFYFADMHLGVQVFNRTPEFSFEIFSQKENKVEPIIGTWINSRKDKLIRVVKKHNGIYWGIVIASKNARIRERMVLYELRRNKDNTYATKVNILDRVYFGPAKMINDSQFVVSYYDKWKKIRGNGSKEIESLVLNDPSPQMFSLGHETVVIKVPECSFEASGIIDSLLSVNNSVLNNCKNIIIDLRENSGGTILALEKLLPLCGLTIDVSPGGELVCSNDNIQVYSDDLNFLTEKKIRPEIIQELRNTLDSLCKYKGGIYYRKADTTPIVPRWSAKDQKKIGIIMNYRTASAAELFILKAIRSKYVKLYGESSAGAIYTVEANTYTSADSTVAFTIPMVKLDLEGIKNITKDKRIAPDIRLFTSDWLKEAFIRMNKEKAR